MSGVLQAAAPLTHAEGLSDFTEQRLVMKLVMSQNYQLWAVSVKRETNYQLWAVSVKR